MERAKKVLVLIARVIDRLTLLALLGAAVFQLVRGQWVSGLAFLAVHTLICIELRIGILTDAVLRTQREGS